MTFVALDEDEAIRKVWGTNLTETMTLLGKSPAQLVADLSAVDVKVSNQTVSQWKAGQTAPRPHVMIAIAGVLRVPPRVLFPLDITRVAA